MLNTTQDATRDAKQDAKQDATKDATRKNYLVLIFFKKQTKIFA